MAEIYVRDQIFGHFWSNLNERLCTSFVEFMCSQISEPCITSCNESILPATLLNVREEGVGYLVEEVYYQTYVGDSEGDVESIGVVQPYELQHFTAA